MLVTDLPSGRRHEIAYLRARVGAFSSVALAVLGLVFVPDIQSWIPLLLVNAGLMYVLAGRLREGSADAWAALVSLTSIKAATWIVLGVSDMTAPGQLLPILPVLYLPMGLNKVAELVMYLMAWTSLRHGKNTTKASAKGRPSDRPTAANLGTTPSRH